MLRVLKYSCLKNKEKWRHISGVYIATNPIFVRFFAAFEGSNLGQSYSLDLSLDVGLRRASNGTVSATYFTENLCRHIWSPSTIIFTKYFDNFTHKWSCFHVSFAYLWFFLQIVLKRAIFSLFQETVVFVSFSRNFYGKFCLDSGHLPRPGRSRNNSTISGTNGVIFTFFFLKIFYGKFPRSFSRNSFASKFTFT